MILYVFTQHWVNTLVKFKPLKHFFFDKAFPFDCSLHFFTNWTEPSRDTFNRHSVNTVALMQPCKPSNRLQTQQFQSTIMQFPERYFHLTYFGSQSLVSGKGAESLFIHYSISRQRGRVSLESQDLVLEKSLRPQLVIGSPCIVPPGRYDSPCRGKGAGIWRWSRHSWRAADRAAGHIQRALLRRQGRGGSSQTPIPHTESPAWKQRGLIIIP